MPVVILVGGDAAEVGRLVRERREAGERVAGWVGDPGTDGPLVAAMGAEMFGGVDDDVTVVVVGGG